MIKVTYHDDLKEVQADAALMKVLTAPATGAPFDRIEWWTNLTENFGILPLIAVARNDQGGGVILPLRRVKRRIEMLTCWYNFRVNPIFFGNLNLRLDDDTALLWSLFQDLAGQAPHLIFSPIPDEHREASTLDFALGATGWVVFKEQCDVNHVLTLNGRSYAEYLATRPGSLRTTLKRKGSKVDVRIETTFNPESWVAYEAIYAQSWKPEEGSPAFLRRFAEEEAAAGRMRLGLAFADGEAVAAQFWTVEGSTAFIHKLAHTEASKPLSPGTTLSAALFEHVIDTDKVYLIDFGTGNDGYKRGWMEEVRPRYRIEAYRPLWPGNWPAIAKHVLRRLAQRGKHGYRRRFYDLGS